MTPAALAGRLNRLQNTKRFKVVATIVLLALAVVVFSSWVVAVNAPAAGDGSSGAQQVESSPQASPAPPAADAQPSGAPEPSLAREGEGQVVAERAQAGDDRVSTADIRTMLASRSQYRAVGFGILAVTALSCVVVWLGLGLTYLGLAAAVAVVTAPLTVFEATREWGRLLTGAAALTASFAVLMQALRLLLGWRTPVFAVARNVLNEAVRLKISVVFIVLLIFLLASLPNLLNESQPLRYRVQSFLQYGVSGTFWVLALLTLFFSVATVAFEQRDRVIWQTMSKPVAPWQYILGKWLGVMALNAALLGVSASGVFLFTDYLARQRAQGEMAPFVSATTAGEPTLDRLLLETQVLVARRGRGPTLPPIDPAEVLDAANRRVGEIMAREPDRPDPEALQAEIFDQMMKERIQQQRTVAPARTREFVFEGLGEARAERLPVTLRFKIQSGANNPAELYRILFIINGVEVVREATLNTAQTIALRPEAISTDGTIRVEVVNGDPLSGRINPYSFTFPPDGMEVLYAASSYEANFLRVMVALWVKLGFVAAVGIAGATFLSFPVACLLAVLVLFAAESSNFLAASLEEYPVRFANEDAPRLHRYVIRAVAIPVAWVFRVYGDLKPTASLVDGRLVAWSAMAREVAVLGVWTIGSLLSGWAIFRKRELGLYSGH